MNGRVLGEAQYSIEQGNTLMTGGEAYLAGEDIQIGDLITVRDDGLVYVVRTDPNDITGVAGNEGLAKVLGNWWMEVAEDEVKAVVPKAVEYGADDLVEIGRELGLLLNRQLTDEEAAELGIYFYLVGKMARWRSAIRRDDRPSDDTLHDVGVYVRMAQRVRAVGGWPFAPGQEA